MITIILADINSAGKPPKVEWLVTNPGTAWIFAARHRVNR